MDVSFNTASRFLQRLAVPSFPQAHDRLVALLRTANLMDAYQACFPDKRPEVGALGLHDMDEAQLLALQQNAISAVAALFPIQEDYMDMLVQDDGTLQIHPESCGFAWDDEWMCQALQDPAELQPDSDLAMFFKLLWIITTQFGEEESRQVWEKMQEHFGYPCDYPNVGGKVRSWDFRWEAYHALLESEGLGLFWRAINVALCDTHNLFLDTSPDDYGYGNAETPDFTAANILELQRIWAEAEAWLADYETCRALVQSNPSIYTQLADLWQLACPAGTRPNQTLLEVFEEENFAPRNAKLDLVHPLV
jgi:hypothetical protein